MSGNSGTLNKHFRARDLARNQAQTVSVLKHVLDPTEQLKTLNISLYLFNVLFTCCYSRAFTSA